MKVADTGDDDKVDNNLNSFFMDYSSSSAGMPSSMPKSSMPAPILPRSPPPISTDFEEIPTKNNSKKNVVSNEIEYESSCINSLPKLNETQERISSSFIKNINFKCDTRPYDSRAKKKEKVCTLVQGPPGTGKTTLITDIIVRLLNIKYVNPRILVSAPSNKAVMVIGNRTLESLAVGYGSRDVWTWPVNIAIIGVEGKLAGEKMGDSKDEVLVADDLLCGSFVWTFCDYVTGEIGKFIKLICPPNLDKHQKKMKMVSIDDMRLYHSNLSKFNDWLYNQIPDSYNRHGLDSYFATALVDLSRYFDDSDEPVFYSVMQSLVALQEIFTNEMDRKNVAADKLNSANAIFSTLHSAGQAVMKATEKVDVLIIDEAACATEPMTLIPMVFLRPTKMLLVGDPWQLPATVNSRWNTNCGYEKSFMERIMVEGGGDYEMLDVQYRMNPEIRYVASVERNELWLK